MLEYKDQTTKEVAERPEELVTELISLVLAVLAVHCRTEIPDQPEVVVCLVFFFQKELYSPD